MVTGATIPRDEAQMRRPGSDTWHCLNVVCSIKDAQALQVRTGPVQSRHGALPAHRSQQLAHSIERQLNIGNLCKTWAFTSLAGQGL